MSDNSDHIPPSARLRRLLLARRGKSLTVGGVLLAFGTKAPGVLLMLLGVLLIIPKAGIPVGALVAVAVALVAVQMLMGKAHLPVSDAWAARELPPKATRRVLLFSFRRFRWLERHLKPRLDHVTSAAMRPLLAVVILLLAAVIALPVPFGDILPGFALLLIGGGLVLGDGIAVLVGLGASVLGIGVMLGLASLLFFGGKAILG